MQELEIIAMTLTFDLKCCNVNELLMKITEKENLLLHVKFIKYNIASMNSQEPSWR